MRNAPLSTLLSQSIEKLKLLIEYDEQKSLHTTEANVEYGLISRENRSEGIYRFHQTIAIQANSATENTAHRFLFTIYSVDLSGNLSKLGDKSLSSTINQEFSSKSLKFEDSNAIVKGTIYFTMYSSKNERKLGESDILYGMNVREKNPKQLSQEYSFLLSRKLRRAKASNNETPVVFDRSLDNRVQNDANWYLSEDKNSSQKPTRSDRQTRRENAAAKSLMTNSPPKLRSTSCNVRYVNNGWPNSNSEENKLAKKRFQMQLIKSKKVNVLNEISKQLKAKSDEKMRRKKEVQVLNQQELEMKLQNKRISREIKEARAEIKRLESQLFQIKNSPRSIHKILKNQSDNCYHCSHSTIEEPKENIITIKSKKTTKNQLKSKNKKKNSVEASISSTLLMGQL